MPESARPTPAATRVPRARSHHARALLAALVALASLLSAPARATPPGAMPPGATPAAPVTPYSPAWTTYHMGKKSEGTALAIEFLLPGFGSVYAGHWQGAATTWALSAAGFVAMVWGFSHLGYTHSSEDEDTAAIAILGGLALSTGARIHGLVDAFRSASRYNRGLARRLGLHGGVIVAPVPMQVNGQTTVGLGASWRF